MLLKTVEAILNKILIKDIREGAIGDLWESHYLLLKKNKPKNLVNIVILWNALTLVSASFKISIERMGDNILQKYNRFIKLIHNLIRRYIANKFIFSFVLVLISCSLILIVEKVKKESNNFHLKLFVNENTDLRLRLFNWGKSS